MTPIQYLIICFLCFWVLMILRDLVEWLLEYRVRQSRRVFAEALRLTLEEVPSVVSRGGLAWESFWQAYLPVIESRMYYLQQKLAKVETLRRSQGLSFRLSVQALLLYHDLRRLDEALKWYEIEIDKQSANMEALHESR
jgi:hypothetical protein